MADVTHMEGIAPRLRELLASLDAISLNLEALTVNATELNKLDGAGAVVASGTQQAAPTALKADYVAEDVDTAAELAVVLNAIAGAVNALQTAAIAFKMVAAPE